MVKNRIIKLSQDGEHVTCLHADFLAGLGKQRMCRASSVEFDEQIGKWVVELRLGPFEKACLAQAFEKRGDALAAEVDFLNEQHLVGAI